MSVTLTAQQQLAMAQALDAWFMTNGKDYPWRQTTDPYSILVSEMMLQQTQITTVLERGYYYRWMEKFPDVATLAAADVSEVLRTWEGLGYYRRARFLHEMAKVVHSEKQGQFPEDVEGLRKLPGVGEYTAGAVASFAYNLPAPLVDGNVARVLMRLYNDPTPIDSTAGKAALWNRATEWVTAARSARVHNSALMELGQTLCRTAEPVCLLCPVREWCGAEDPAALPVKDKKIAITEVTERVFFHRMGGQVLLEQEVGKRRTGLWKLPGLPEEAEPPAVLHQSRYTITRYRVQLWVHQGRPELIELSGKPQYRMVSEAEIPSLPMPSPYRKALTALLLASGS